MGRLLNLVTPLHRATGRDYLARMRDDKVTCMRTAKEYGFDYWDGDRRFGYGGYGYIPGRWKPVAEALIETYGLKAGSRVLDVGCGKAFLLYEMQRIEPGLELTGCDVSDFALAAKHEHFTGTLLHHRAQDPYPWPENHFDLVLSVACLHNLRIMELQIALGEIERVGRNKFIMLESFRNERELFNLQCWSLTAASFLDTEAWLWLYEHFGYTGDYEFIYFE